MGICALFALALSASTSPDAASPVKRYDLETLLGKPVSPGMLALLLPHADDQRARARVTESLSHSEPRVRAAAARVASVLDLRSSMPAVRLALEAEADRSAAFEQLRAAVLLGLPKDDAALIPLAAKHDLVAGLADSLAAARGPAALPLLDPLRAAGLPERIEGPLIAVATRGGQEGLNAVAAIALRTENSRTWSIVLSLAREPRAELSPGMLLAALGSAKPEIRAATYWHLAVTHDKRSGPAPEIDAAIARTPEAASPHDANVDAAFALVALRRAQAGSRAGEDWGERAASGAPVVPMVPAGVPKAVSRLLTRAEARALSRRMTDGRSEEMFDSMPPPAKPGRIDGKDYGGLSFTGGLPPGMVRDILVVSGCKPAPDLRVTGFVDYGADGRPRRVGVGAAPPSSACPEAAGPALALTLAPPSRIDPLRPTSETPVPAGLRTLLIVPLDEEALACADEPEPATAERVAEEGEVPIAQVQPPRKLKNVAPWYPARAREAWRQGTVVLEAVISPTGCIRSARVVRGVAPDLDAAAMIAVGKWQYAPTLLRGKPVPVIMTVTVNFRLSR